jgi:hypothetical protein
VCIISNLNSFIFDYLARQKVIGIHLGSGIIQQLPFVPPEKYLRDCLWNTENLCVDFFIPRILELTYTAWDLQPFAQDCGYGGAPSVG